MLSVKHITLSGNETIRLASKVEFVNTASKQCAPAHDTLWVHLPDGNLIELEGGTVFVMNDIGKTISRYDLGASMVPLNPSLHDEHRMRKASVEADRSYGLSVQPQPV
jgi:hypothetical protein